MRVKILTAVALVAGSAAWAQPPSKEIAVQLPRVVALTEKDMTGFVQSLTELKKLGIEAKVTPGQSDVQNMARALETNSAAMSILSRNGFTLERFRQVTYSIALALGALDKQGSKTDKARSEHEQALEQMKAQLPPEQYELMRKQLEAASTVLDQVQNQPAQNLELATKYRARIEAAAAAAE